MTIPNIDHPTDRPNFSIVRLPGVLPTVAFSYETPIGFIPPGDWNWVTRENAWGPTTGRHLNWLTEDRSTRLPGPEFEAALAVAFAEGAALTAGSAERIPAR